MLETPDYRIVTTTGEIELRAYSPYIVAEVTVRASSLREAPELGFQPLAAYIFGNNLPKDEIAMTAPVTAEASGTEIAMTAPVTSTATVDGTYTVRFSMPSSWTIETLPEPNDPQIRLVVVDAQQLVAIAFRGGSDPKRLEAGGRALVAHAEANELVVDGGPIWAGFSAPSVPVPLRKWEMHLQVRPS